jgi:nifR3 family TIM-barrel protein
MKNQFSKPLQTKIDRLKKKQRPLKLGKVNFSSPLLLAPMSSICNAPFRLLMEELGAGGTVSELISCHGIIRKNEKTTKMLFVDPKEKNVGLQIFGEEDSIMAEAAQVAESFSPKFIDINMGCPVRKVVTKGGGSALLREPKKLASFFSTIKKNLSIPLSIKIRTGWDETNINADEIINVAHNEGIEFVAIHGRTRTQQYKGKADWNYLEKISSNSPLPVIGNGDLNAKNDIIRRLHTTHCQALMIGRAALRNPFIFLEGIQEEGDETTFSAQDIFEVSERLFSHLRNTVDRERVLLVQMRKHLIWLAAGYKNVSHFRNELFRTDNVEDIQQISQEYFLSLGPAQKSIKDSQSFMMGGHG